MATAPLHCAAGIVLAKALPLPWAIVMCVLVHPLMDFYPEHTFDYKRMNQRDWWFCVVEFILFLTAVSFIRSWTAFICVAVSVLPDVVEEIYQYLSGARWTKTLFFWHGNNWQQIAMTPIRCMFLDVTIFTLILIGA